MPLRRIGEGSRVPVEPSGIGLPQCWGQKTSKTGLARKHPSEVSFNRSLSGVVNCQVKRLETRVAGSSSRCR
jgi:hypothetical protein